MASQKRAARARIADQWPQSGEPETGNFDLVLGKGHKPGQQQPPPTTDGSYAAVFGAPLGVDPFAPTVAGKGEGQA